VKPLCALAYGILAHGLFAVGVIAMIAGLHEGLATGLGRLEGGPAIAVDALLVLQFPLLHSLLLGRHGARWLGKLAPFGLGRDLVTTTYAAFASLQVCVVFLGWSPIASASWRPHGAALVLLELLFALAWLVLGKAMWDAGLSLQLGFTGWWAAFRSRRPSYRPFPTAGLFRRCRQPVYLGFALTLWTAPVWTIDRFALVVVWTAYCFLGPRLKERRFERRFGEDFRRYQREVRYIVPIRKSA
jgi:methanethiol S-methyltransferase